MIAKRSQFPTTGCREIKTFLGYQMKWDDFIALVVITGATLLAIWFLVLITYWIRVH